ncbi:hypothetical protein [Delftia acidovorans]|uniref:hypothetical protein n=1 Tax=Delftia acidovorans TaxID=80866 RepID=UPI00192AF159|nr:hypothetical protein [Delftia acidovorans]
MTVAQTQAVTYTGNDTPFIDRIYRSRLTFDPGQTRVVPIALAARFLRHSDIFQPGKSSEELAAEAASAQAAADAAQLLADEQERMKAEARAEAARVAAEDAAKREADALNADKPPAEDNTQQLLEEAKAKEEAERAREEVRHSVLQQIENMDKQALRDWTKQTYKQELPGNLGLDKMRERVRGFVDQFGVQ